MRSLASHPSASLTLSSSRKPRRHRRQSPPEPADRPQPSDPPVDPQEPDEFEEPDSIDVPCTDDSHWDVFIPDDDQYDPLPDPGDFANDEFPDDK